MIKNLKSDYGGLTLIELIITLIITTIVIAGGLYSFQYSRVEQLDEIISKKANFELKSYLEYWQNRLENSQLTIQEFSGDNRRGKDIIIDNKRNIEAKIFYGPIIEIDLPETQNNEFDYFLIPGKIKWIGIDNRERFIYLEAYSRRQF